MTEKYTKDQRCLNCYYSRPYEAPDEEDKPQPEEVKLFWGLIKYTEYPDDFQMIPYAICKARHDKSVKCLFNPKHIEKDKMSWCGQWKEKEDK